MQISNEYSQKWLQGRSLVETVECVDLFFISFYHYLKRSQRIDHSFGESDRSEDWHANRSPGPLVWLSKYWIGIRSRSSERLEAWSIVETYFHRYFHRANIYTKGIHALEERTRSMPSEILIWTVAYEEPFFQLLSSLLIPNTTIEMKRWTLDHSTSTA